MTLCKILFLQYKQHFLEPWRYIQSVHTATLCTRARFLRAFPLCERGERVRWMGAYWKANLKCFSKPHACFRIYVLAWHWLGVNLYLKKIHCFHSKNKIQEKIKLQTASLCVQNPKVLRTRCWCPVVQILSLLFLFVLFWGFFFLIIGIYMGEEESWS